MEIVVNSIRLIVSAGALCVLAACATTSENQGSAFSNFNDCIFARSISDWRPLDRRNLIVFAGRRNPYHVQLSRQSMRLSFQQQLGFYDRDGRICPFGGDAVVIDGAIPERITISSIRRLSGEQLTEVYMQFGIERPEIITAPPNDD